MGLKKILLVDDHEVVRIGIKTLLERQGVWQVVGEAESAVMAMKLAITLQPDIVILDLRMPQISGAEICRSLKEKDPKIKVIVLTAFGGEADVRMALEAGVDGYVLKNAGGGHLLKTVERVGRGEKVLDPQVAGQVMAYLEKGRWLKEDLGELSSQEKKLLALIGQGKTNKEISAELFLSDKTVRNQISRLLHKLDLKNRSQAAALAERYGLVEEPVRQ